MTSLYFKQLPLGPMDNFIYLIGDPATKEAAVVDPAWNVPKILEVLKQDGYRLTHAFLTHGHYDHVNGVEEIVAATQATVCVAKEDFELLMVEGAGGMVIPRRALPNVSFADSIRLGSLTVEFFRTPGHTPGSRCIRVQAQGEPAKLMTGDTLFVGTIGRCDFPYSNHTDLFATLQWIKSLPEETIFYPAHDYGPTPSNTLAREKRSNVFLLSNSEEDFFDVMPH